MSLWEQWWTYLGISGPKYWGLLNPKCRMCSEGRRQSPINIDLQRLLFDSTLAELHISPGEIQLLAYNTDLYDNFSESEKSPPGLTVVSTFIQLNALPCMSSGRGGQSGTLLEHNRRPVMPSNYRPIKTNINLGQSCMLKKKVFYKANELYGN